MQLNHENLQRKNHELAEALREKSRKHNQMQELYNKLKRRTLYSRVQTAASEAVDQSLHGNVTSGERHDIAPANVLHDHHFSAPRSPQRMPLDNQLPRDHAVSGHTYGQFDQGNNLSGGGVPTIRAPLARPGAGWLGGVGPGARKLKSCQVAPLPNLSSDNDPMTTPSHPRQQLPTPTRQHINAGSYHQSSSRPNGHPQNHSPHHRQPLIEADLNNAGRSTLGGYGLSAGMKVGRQFTAASNLDPKVGSLRGSNSLPLF